MIVLILVLMEDTLRADGKQMTGGICLNPCFNGRYSQSNFVKTNEAIQKVLILVLMEDTLRAMKDLAYKAFLQVLILVLMEDTLRERYRLCQSYPHSCLNPCFNGRYSQRCYNVIQQLQWHRS